MPNWLILLLTILGSSGILGVYLNHKLQQGREHDTAKRAMRAEWVGRRRNLCLDLMESVIRFKGQVITMESLHNNLAARPFAKKTMELSVQDMIATMEPIRKFRRELDLEPNAQLQEAIDHFGDAALAYGQALMRPMSSPWNPVQYFWGKSPKEEISQLAQEYHARTEGLQEAIRAYMASLERSDSANHKWWPFSRHRAT